MKKELENLRARLQKISTQDAQVKVQKKPVPKADAPDIEPVAVDDKEEYETEEIEYEDADEDDEEEYEEVEEEVEPVPMPQPKRIVRRIKKKVPKQVAVEKPQQVLTAEQNERLRQLQIEQERLQNNPSYRLEIIFQLNRLNDNIETLIKKLG